MLSLYLILFAIAGLGILALALIAFGHHKQSRPVSLSSELDDDAEIDDHVVLDVSERLSEVKSTVIVNANVADKELSDPTLASLGFSALDTIVDEEELVSDTHVVAIPEVPTQQVQPEYHPQNRAAKNIVIFYLFAPAGQVFTGYELLQSLLAADLRFGEKRIFHRYEQPDGKGKILFSVATAIEPGIFDIADIGGFSCPGLCLFMSPDQFSNPAAIFEVMLETAQQLAEDLGGRLCNENREPLTEEEIAEYGEQFV